MEAELLMICYYGHNERNLPRGFMRKIYIVGMVASGKTTFARNLSKEIGIPFYELDCIVHVKTSEGQIYRRLPK